METAMAFVNVSDTVDASHVYVIRELQRWRFLEIAGIAVL